MEMSQIDEYFKGKNVLVTGASGSIGRFLVKRLLELKVNKVRALDINETELAMLSRRFSSSRLEIYLGDVRDRYSVRDAVQDIDIIFHAAALKHVPLSEYYPLEYIKTNILGTQNIIDEAKRHNVEKFILISTDKAVNPINVMGATKLLAERLTIIANLRSPSGSIFSCVRFGNVLYTRGSVIEIFMRQIRNGYITLTDPNMTRFIMGINDAINLILKSTYLARGGEIFILKMKSVRIGDLAKAFIEVFAKNYGYNPNDIRIIYLGKRPGEKMHEELMTEYESLRAIEYSDTFVVCPEIIERRCGIDTRPGKRPKRYTSKDAPQLNVDEIKKLLIEFYKIYSDLY